MKQQELYRYYSTQRPVDLGTYPKEPDNPLVGFLNYDDRISVEHGAFRAWGHLTYTKPLTDKQVADYELRPAFNVHELRRKRGERPLTIAEQMKAAQQQAQEQRGPEAPKKDAPDRGER